VKLTNSKDGVHRVTLRVEHRLDKEELVNALYLDVAYFEVFDDLPEKMPEAEIIKRIKKTLQERGEELFPEDFDEDYKDWCEAQVTRILK
jgi:hypothetical protein